MIELDKRKAIILLHSQGMGIREIAKKLKMSRNTVRDIIREPGQFQQKTRSDKVLLEENLLQKLFEDCDGWVQRVHEKLADAGIHVGYSTVTQRLRELGIGVDSKKRSGQFPDHPGVELQHDTSPYSVEIGGKVTKVVASSIYFRYSKVRYLKFYRFFRRFEMKCFFHESLTHFGYCATQCVIDNTNLAVLEGTGKNAIFVPEMIVMAESYGFKWLAHEKGHSNRKAGEERSFWTVETNFFPGRKFASLEDLNQQARIWSTETFEVRPHSKTRLIPRHLFEQEKPFLKKIPPFVQPPYLQHDRDVDQYGYSQFEGNFYWIPGASLEKVLILQYSHSIKIYRHRSLLTEYLLPPFGTKNQKFKPPGAPENPYEPQNRRKNLEDEEKKLRAISPEVDSFIEFVTTQPGSLQFKQTFIRKLYRLHQSISRELLTKTLERAKKYRVTDVTTIERIATQLMKQEIYQLPLFDTVEEFENREAYQEGKLTDEPDLTRFDDQTDSQDDED
jgi:transposase